MKKEIKEKAIEALVMVMESSELKCEIEHGEFMITNKEDFLDFVLEKFRAEGIITDQMPASAVVYTVLWELGYHSDMAMHRGYLSDMDVDTIGLEQILEAYYWEVISRYNK